MSRRASGTVPEASVRAAARQDLAYRMQKWPRLQFDQEVEAGGVVADAIAKKPQNGGWQAFTRELFGRLYGHGVERVPEDEVGDGARWASELHSQADVVPEFAALEGRVVGDSWRASLAAGAAARVLADRMPDPPEEDVEALQDEADWLAEQIAQTGRAVNVRVLQRRGEIQRRLAAARGRAEAALEAARASGGATMRSALREAAQAAQSAAQEADEAMEGLGCGTGAGSTVRRRVAKRLSASEKLRRIAALAGRLKAQARRKQRTRSDKAREELYGVEKGDALPRLLASEVGLLPRPETRSLLLMRLAERQALQHRLRGKEPKSRGPIVFLIDTSGSMRGEREVWSKSVALAMMEIARIQRRGFAVLFFNTAVVKEFAFDPQTATVDEVMECLEFFASGGTNIANALRGAHAKTQDAGWKPGKDADVVLISDGDDRSDVSVPCGEMKGDGVALHVLSIEGACSRELSECAETATNISRSDMGGPSAKLDAVFSV